MLYMTLKSNKNHQPKSACNVSCTLGRSSGVDRSLASAWRCHFCVVAAAASCLVWCCHGSALCCLWLSVLFSVWGRLRDEDQYLLRHPSPALDQDSPCGQLMLLAHLEHQDKEQLQCTLARLENENR